MAGGKPEGEEAPVGGGSKTDGADPVLEKQQHSSTSHAIDIENEDTCEKTNTEFRNEVNKTLAWHERRLDDLNATSQNILKKLQEASSNQPHSPHFAASLDPSQQSQLKLHFPKFNGEDPIGWIYRAEQYFEFQAIGAERRVQLASFHLEGIALQWHRWFTKFQGPVTWDELTKAILLRFGPTEYEDPSEALTRLKQTSTVAEYQEAFERFSYQVDGLPEKFLIGCFVAGLKDEIRLDVKIKQPRSLTDAIGVARLVEERNGLQIKGDSSFNTPPKLGDNNKVGILGPLPALKPSPGAINNANSFKGITSQEVRERKEKGQCYFCGEKFFLGHRCQRPQLLMLEDIPDFILVHKDNLSGGE